MAELTCGIEEDLLPLYAEGLTGEESRRNIEAHLAGCDACRRRLDEMRADARPAAIAEKEAAAVDYMKKNRLALRYRLLIIVLLCAALCACLFCVRHNFREHLVLGEQVAVESIMVDGGSLHIEGSLRDESQGVKVMDFTLSGDTVIIGIRACLANPFAKNEFWADFSTNGDIGTVMLGERVIWEDGTAIPDDVSAVFAAAHPYLGSMPDNAGSAQALEMGRELGPFRNELQTSAEPYSWTVELQDDMGGRNPETLSARMDYFGAMLIATIGNLGEVRYVYEADGVPCEHVITEADADARYGSSVKEAGESASGLLALMNGW